MASYWNEKHQILCEKWINADTKEEFRIYDKLRGVMLEMFYNISRRYFSLTTVQQQDIQEEVIQHVMLVLKSHYKPELQKAYTFAGTCMRNYIHDIFVRKYITHYKTTYDFYDDLPQDSKPIDYGEHLDVDVDLAVEYFNELKKKVKKDYYKDKTNQRELDNIKYNRLIQVLDCCIDYVKKFESLHIYGMAEYCFHQMKDVHEQTLGHYFYYLFGFHIRVFIDKDSYKKTEGLDYMFDDFTPLEYTNISNKRNRIKKYLKEISK